jgi:Ni,Fe-hydrogenase III small subunit
MWQTLKQIARVGCISEPAPADSANVTRGDAEPLRDELARLLGRALAVRVVDAGSCNGCELEINALGNPYYNLEGLGVHFVASPRHADLLLVSGPVSRHMEQALQRTWEAMPEPRLVVAVGDCARDGGVFGCSYACRGGVQGLLPVDVYVAGCPPTPRELLAAMLQAVRARR